MSDITKEKKKNPSFEFYVANFGLFLILVILTRILLAPLLIDPHTKDTLYWVFSASGQAIAAFVGFLVASYIFIFERISGIRDPKDEDFQLLIKRFYFGRLMFLCIITGLAILINIYMLIINQLDQLNYEVKALLISSALALTSLAVVNGTIFCIHGF